MQILETKNKTEQENIFLKSQLETQANEFQEKQEN